MSAEQFWFNYIRRATTRELRRGLTLGGYRRDTLSLFDELVETLADLHSWDSMDISVRVTTRSDGVGGVAYSIILDNHDGT